MKITNKIINSKNWIFIFFTPIFLSMFFIVIINFTIDQQAYFRVNQNLNNAISALVSGKSIAELQFNDHRILNKKIIDKTTKKIDLIALGSSRNLLLRKDYIDNNYTFLNHSMPASTLGDYLSIIGLYKYLKGYLPNSIIIGVDPWVFNSNSNYNYKWKRLQKYYFKLINEINYNQDFYNSEINNYGSIIEKLFSWGYMKQNIEHFKKVYLQSVKYFSIVNKKNLGLSIRNPDGSIHYPDEYLNRDIKFVLEDAKNPNLYKGGLNNFYSIQNKEIFENLINYLLRKKIKIILFLPPYHPTSYEALIKSDEIVNIQDVENYLVSLSKSMNIQLIGSYDPKKLNLSEFDFMDGFHAKDFAVEKIYKRLQIN